MSDREASDRICDYLTRMLSKHGVRWPRIDLSVVPTASGLDSLGRYWSLQLNGGKYEMSVSAGGYSQRVRSLVEDEVEPTIERLKALAEAWDCYDRDDLIQELARIRAERGLAKIDAALKEHEDA